MPIIITPNMSLPVPVVGQELGPQYATDINNCLSQVDAHNHTPGFGVQIPPTGLNINSDLTFMNNRATNLKSAMFFSQGSPLAAVAPDLGAIYVSGADLYYNDTAGNQVRITQGGSVAGASGSITGLVPPASATYVVGNSSFVWQSNVNTAAGMDGGPVTIRDIAANAKGITLQSPVSLPADYSLTFPSGLPGSTQLVEVDTAGNISFTTPSLLSVLGTSTTFTGAGTYMYTIPAGVHYIRIIACGGGGGGQGGQNGPGSGGGGGGGSPVFEGALAVVPGEVLTIVVGAGGGPSANGSPPSPAFDGTATTITGSTSGLILTTGFGRGGGSTGIGNGGLSYGPGIHAQDGIYNAGPFSNGGGYKTGATIGDAITWRGQGGSNNGAGGGGGAGSIGNGGEEVVSPGPGGAAAPWSGGIGAGGGGQDAGFNGAGGPGGDGQVTIYVQ